MDLAYQSLVLDWLRRQGVRIAAGLSEEEIRELEQEYSLMFPPDLRGFLQAALPVTEPFPNWRGPQEHLRERLDWPVDGICFDIEHNNHWNPSWGERPARLLDAFAVARREIAKAPRLIPVYSHRYLVSEPCKGGNPVLSVYQTDIICYGYDLSSYFREEFGILTAPPSVSPPKAIPFWGYYVGGIWDPNHTPQPATRTKADLPPWRGHAGIAFVRDLRVCSATDVLVYLQVLGPPALWLWCQTDGLPPETGSLTHDWYLWLDSHLWQPAASSTPVIVQPTERSPYTELTGMVVLAEPGEIRVHCEDRFIRVLLEGELPAEGEWITVSGILHGQMDPEH